MKLTLLLTLCFLVATSAFCSDLLVSHMQNGDRIEVTHHTDGCFGDSTHYFEIARSNDIYSFMQYAITWEKSIPPSIKEKKTLGTLILAKQDIAGLDGLLKVYRGKKVVHSEQPMSVLMEYYGPAGRVKVEKLDGSKGLRLEDRKDVVTFFALASRFPDQGIKQGATAIPAKPGS